MMNSADELDNDEKQLSKERDIVQQELTRIDKNIVIIETIREQDYDTFVLDVSSLGHHEAIVSLFSNTITNINILQYSVIKKAHPMTIDKWPHKPLRMTIQITRLAAKKIGKIMIFRIILKVVLSIISVYTFFLFVLINR